MKMMKWLIELKIEEIDEDDEMVERVVCLI